MASTRQAAFKEMPGAAPDVMRDYDLATLGYEETEFSLEGTATSYELQGERGADGRWDVTPGAEAPFRTRFVVRRPVDPLRFSGTVVVEWHNVSAGIDAAPDWGFFHRHLAAAGPRLGRRVGAEGRHRRRGLRREHPPQAAGAGALRRARASRRRLVLRHLHAGRPACCGCRATRTRSAAWRPTQILAAGESQSAACLVTYINADRSRTRSSSTASSCTGDPASGVSIDGVFIPASQRSGMEATRVAISSQGRAHP